MSKYLLNLNYSCCIGAQKNEKIDFHIIFNFTLEHKKDILHVDVSQVKIQSTLVISKSNGLSEILRDIRTLTYQIYGTEEKINRTTKFHK